MKAPSKIMKKKFSSTFLAISIACCFTSSVWANFPTAVHRGDENHFAAAAPGSTLANAAQLSGKPQAAKDAPEAGSNQVPGFLFLMGFGLIGLRLVVSNWPKKVKNLAARTN
jgi:hypothetical protein